MIKKRAPKHSKRFSFSTFKNNKGFSLMEMLVYVGILGIVASIAGGIFLSVTKVQTEQTAQVEISGQLNFAMQTIQRLIKNSSLIDTSAGTPTSSLTLRMKDASVDPTIIYLENGRIYVKEGTNGTPQSITSDKVTVNSLEFKKLTQYPGKDVVQIDLAMSATDKVEGKTISRSLRSAISRASAAVFDSDLLPGADNTYSVGTSNRWKNASFSGNVGIGVTTLLNKLDVAGGVAIGSYAGVNTAPSNGLIISGNVGIGVATPAAGTKLDIYTSSANEIGLLLRDDGGARIFSIAELGAGGYNPMSSAGDIGLIYYGTSGQNTGSLMIGQWSSSARGIKIDASGNVGIGTGTPGEKLEVAGNIKLSGATPTYKITNVASPTNSSDVATKGYVDAAVGGGNLNVYKSDGVTLLGKFLGIADTGQRSKLSDEIVSSYTNGSASIVYKSATSTQWLFYSHYYDNTPDLVIYSSSSTNKISHLATGDSFQLPSRRWYFSSANCSGNIYTTYDYFIYPTSVIDPNYGYFISKGQIVSRNYDKVIRCVGEITFDSYGLRLSLQDAGSCISVYNPYYTVARSYLSYRNENTGACVNVSTSTAYTNLDSYNAPIDRLCGPGECVIK